MKFTTTASLLLLATSVVASSWSERSIDVDDHSILIARAERILAKYADTHWRSLEVREGPWAKPNARTKKDAKDFVDSNHNALKVAGTGGNSARTMTANNAFHLDRQQGKNTDGSSAVAVQLNKGRISTIGQVKIEKHPDGKHPSGKTVAARLKHSINTGKETKITAPRNKKGADGAKSARKEANIAKNKAAQAAKKERVAQKEAAGKARAAAGIFRKGNKGSIAQSKGRGRK